MPGHGGSPISSRILNMRSSESELLRVCMPSHEHTRYKSKLGPIPPGLNRISHKFKIGTGDDYDPTPGPHTPQGRVQKGTDDGSVGRGENSTHAIRRRRLVCNENGRSRYNHRPPNPSRSHLTNLPYPCTDIATYEAGPYIWHRGPGERQEEDRMGSSGVPPSGPATGVNRDQPPLREEGVPHRRWVDGSQKWGASLHGHQSHDQTEANRSRIHNFRFNPPHLQSQRGKILLPPYKRGRQQDIRSRNKMDPKTTQIPSAPTCTWYKRSTSTVRPRGRTIRRFENFTISGQIHCKT